MSKEVPQEVYGMKKDKEHKGECKEPNMAPVEAYGEYKKVIKR